MTSHVRRKRVGGVERLGDDLQRHSPLGNVVGCQFRVWRVPTRHFLGMLKLVIGPSGHGQGDRIRLRHGVAIGRDIGQPHDRHDDLSFGE